MSDQEPIDPLMAEVNQMMQGIDDQISIEKVMTIASRVIVNLEVMRGVLRNNTKFSDEWIESACLRVFNQFFPNGR